MWEGERWTPGPALAMISNRSSSMADFRTIGRTEALASCIANRFASSSDTWLGVIWVSPVEPMLDTFNFPQILDSRLEQLVTSKVPWWSGYIFTKIFRNDVNGSPTCTCPHPNNHTRVLQSVKSSMKFYDPFEMWWGVKLKNNDATSGHLSSFWRIALNSLIEPKCSLF